MKPEKIPHYERNIELNSPYPEWQTGFISSQQTDCLWLPKVEKDLGREDPLEKEMATHSSTLAWKIPWTEEPGRLHSMELQRVRCD